VAEGAVDVGGGADLVDLEPAADAVDLQVDQPGSGRHAARGPGRVGGIGGTAPQARAGEWVAVDLQSLQGAGAVEAVGDPNLGTGPGAGRSGDLQGDPLELGGVVAPAGGDGRVDGGGGPAVGLGGQGGRGRVQPHGQRSGGTRGASRPTGLGQLGRGVALQEGGVGLAGQERL
jgi:hypothetical protein